MTGDEARDGLRRFVVGTLGVATVPLGFAAVAASGFGYVGWLITLIGILLAGSGFDAAEGGDVGWLLAGYFTYTIVSCFLAVRIMRRFPAVSRNASGAVGLVGLWGLFLMAGTIAIITWYNLW